MSPHKVLAVVWRRAWLQSVWRHYVATALEVAGVVGLAYLFLPMDGAGTGIESGKHQAEPIMGRPKIVYPPQQVLLRAHRQLSMAVRYTTAVYGPKNSATDALIRAAFPTLPAANITAVEKRANVLQKCREHWSTSLSPKDVLCVQFSTLFGHADDSSLDYKLHSVTSQEVPEVLPLPRPQRFYLQGDTKTAHIMEDTMEAQSRLDYAFLQSKKTGKHKIPSLEVQQLPELPPAPDRNIYRTTTLVLTTTIYCIPLLRRISAVTNELSTGLKDEQRMNGLSMPEFWLGHHLSGLAIQMVESTAVIWIMFKVSAYRGGYYYDNSDVTLVAFVMVLFNICHILQAMLLSALCQTGRRAMIVALLVAVLAPLQLSSSTNSLGQLVFRDRFKKLLTAVSPQLMGSEVLRTVAIFDEYEGGANWGVLFKHALHLDSVTLFELLVAMCAAAVLYVFLLFFVTNFLPWATDHHMHPLYFLMPHYLVEISETQPEQLHPDRFEEPPNAEPAADIRHVCMVRGTRHTPSLVLWRVSKHAPIN